MDVEDAKEEHVEESETSADICFEKLYDYRFQDNVKFVEGWRKVKDVIAKEDLYKSLIKAQVYFYSREVGQVDLNGYRNWLNENDKKLLDFDVLVSEDQSADQDRGIEEDGVNPSGKRNEKSTNSSNYTESVKNSMNPLTQEDSAGKYPTNFMELIEMIQNGMKLPDTEDLNIVPLNEDPTPCEVQRPKKPWEVS